MHKERREKLQRQLPDYSITVLYSGKAPHSIGDEVYPFKVDRSFYYYTGINDLKLDLIESATQNARDRILIMSGVSGANIGRLKNSSLGVFQITAVNSGTGEYSYDGSFNTSSRDKTATVTVKLEYDLK